ncbi:hypothetical protein [Halobaculum magnesiiphilum]|uniref:Uncharacterized protein n=1 Tax=Halobaculum magnesiiphilum TaxID=1017351 RepID=A0A8T8WG96_9EURY|nr:hypothetical protein [Halobaculum magnesiiphilum]QZP38806.1 hypothetical protein K6T50_06620 [Halobaculum magnesiiphilum]
MSSEDSTARSGRVVNTGDGFERVDDADAGSDAAAAAAEVADADSDPDPSGDAEDDFGRAGWVLVAVVVIAFLVVPGIIYLRPTAPGELGLRFYAAMLVLPFLPALLLGVTAVWSLVAGDG